METSNNQSFIAKATTWYKTRGRNTKVILWIGVFILVFAIFDKGGISKSSSKSSSNSSSDMATCCSCNGNGKAKNAMGTCVICGGTGKIATYSTFYRANCK